MPGNKKRSSFKRRRRGFKGRPSWEPEPDGRPIDSRDSSNIIDRETCPSVETVSKRKLDSHDFESETPKKRQCQRINSDEEEIRPADMVRGYRLIDMNKFGHAVNILHACSDGKQNYIFWFCSLFFSIPIIFMNFH